MFRAIIVASFFVTVSTAMAGDPGEDAIATGLELRRNGKPEETLAQFQKAHALAPSGRTFGQMALAEQSLRRWLDADEHIIAALRDTESPWVRRNRATLDDALANGRKHIGDLVIQGPDGATLVVGGERVGTLPLATPLRRGEGDVMVEVAAAGREPFAKTVTVSGGGKVTTVVAELRQSSVLGLGTAPGADPVPLLDYQTPERSWWRSPWTGGSLVVVGAAAVVVGITWLAVDGNGNCDPSKGGVCPRVFDTRLQGLVSTGIGAVAGIVGGWLLYRRSQTGVTVGIGPGSLVATGRF